MGFPADPIATVGKLHFDLGLPPLIVNPRKVEQITQEDDAQWGMKLHEVRPVVEPNEETWRGVLPDGLAEWINEQYADINQLSKSGVCV